jgi:hypothetical protein
LHKWIEQLNELSGRWNAENLFGINAKR